MRRFSLSVLVILLCTRFPFVKPGISSLKLLPLVLASSFFSGNLLASRAEPVYKGSGNALTIAAESQITYGFYVFSKTSDGSGLSRIFLCLDDGTITLRCNVFDKSRVTLKSFPLFLEKTLKENSFTLEKETYRVFPYGEVWFTRRPFVAASTSLMAYAVKLSNRRPFVAASTSLMAYAVKLSNRRPFVAASTSLMAYAVKLSNRRPFVAASTSLMAYAVKLSNRRPFVAASTSLMAYAVKLSNRRPFVAASTSLMAYAVKLSNRRPFVAASTSLMAYAVKLSNRRPFVAASTSLMAYAVKLSNRRPFVAASTSLMAYAVKLSNRRPFEAASTSLMAYAVKLSNRRPFEAASTSLMAYTVKLSNRRPFEAASTSLMAYAVKLSNRRPFVAASTSLMAYAVKLSNRRPFVAASTSASADAEDLTTSGDCSNANFAPKYNSQELDKESQFYYFNARHYDPELARFVSADTVVDGNNAHSSWNRYMYVHGNPIMYKDPTGHKIVVGGDEKYKAKVAEDLGKLTGTKVTLDEKGTVSLGDRVSKKTENRLRISLND